MTFNSFGAKFAADCGDLLITDCTESLTLKVLKDSQLILQETFSYDADNQIRIGGLAQVLSQSLWGELKEGTQEHATATFTFWLGSRDNIMCKMYSMRLQNPYDPQGRKNVLAMADDGVCYPGQPLLVTVIGEHTVRLCNDGGTIASVSIGTNGSDYVTTVDCDPQKLFPSQYQRGTFIDVGDEIERRIMQPCDDLVTVRFLNRYDMPECLTARYMTEKPATQDDTAVMYGRRTRFSVSSSTEYTLCSGRMVAERQFDTWQDLLTARRAQISWQGQWVDIIVTKSNYTRHRRRHYSSQAEISFRTANPIIML